MTFSCFLGKERVNELVWPLLLFFLLLHSLWCHGWQHQPWTVDQEILGGTPRSQFSRVRYAREPGCHCSGCHSRNKQKCQLTDAVKCGLYPPSYLFLEYLQNLSFSWSVTLTVKCPRETDHAVCSGRDRWSFMYVLTRSGEEVGRHLRSLGSASFPASIPSEAVGFRGHEVDFLFLSF